MLTAHVLVEWPRDHQTGMAQVQRSPFQHAEGLCDARNNTRLRCEWIGAQVTDKFGDYSPPRVHLAQDAARAERYGDDLAPYGRVTR